MNIWWAARIIGMLLVPVYCRDMEYTDFEPRHLQHFYNVLKHTTDSFGIVLDLVKSLDLRVDDYDYEEILRICGLTNKEIFITFGFMYDSVKDLVNWKDISVDPDVLKELEHADNYSEVLKKTLEATIMNSTDDLIESQCQIMPIGPDRVMKVVAQLPTRAEREASAKLQYSNLDKMLENINTVLQVKRETYEIIQDRLQYLLLHDLQDRADLEKKISYLHRDINTYVMHLGEMSRTDVNLVISDDAVKSAEAFTKLALSIRNTFLGFKM